MAILFVLQVQVVIYEVFISSSLWNLFFKSAIYFIFSEKKNIPRDIYPIINMIELGIQYKEIKQARIRPVHTCLEMHSNKTLRENFMALENETLKQFWNSPSEIEILFKRNDAVYNLYFMKLLMFETFISKALFFWKQKAVLLMCYHQRWGKHVM